MRCKAGDLALVINDYPGCEKNIGHAVHVIELVDTLDHEGRALWSVRPANGHPWCLFEDGIIRMEANLSSCWHPDDWLWPIRQVGSEEAIVDELELQA